MIMRNSILILAVISLLFLSACGNGDAPVMTAIAATQAAVGTQTIIDQQQTQSALANIQLTQSAQELVLQLTQAAMQMTQSALDVQSQIQVSIAQTQAIQALTPSVEAGMVIDGTPVPGVNSKSSTGVDFKDARIYSQSSLGNRTYMISIQLSDEVKEITGTYFLEVAAKKFKCSVIKDYPNRLYCNGQSPRGGYHAVRLYEDVGGLARLVFVTDVTLPVWTPTITRGGKPSPTPIYEK